MNAAPDYPSSPELELLLCCARVRPNTAQTQRLAVLLAGPIDWDIAVALASQHGLVPLIHRHLDKLGSGSVPQSVLAVLRAQTHEHAWRNLLLTKELLRILESFESHRIPALPFKGPTLAAVLYGDVSLRPFIDLDILVRPEDVLRAADVLRDRGYLPQQTLTTSQEYFHRRWYNERGFLHPEHKFSVEIQWDIAPKYFSAAIPETVWMSARSLPLANQVVKALSEEDLLLLLCVHGTKHLWSKLRWIVDVAELTDMGDIDWARVVQCARERGCLRMVLIALALARELLEAALPDAVLEHVSADPTIPGLSRHVKSRFLTMDSRLPLREMAVFHLRARERQLDRLKYCLRLALTPSLGDFMAVRLPGPLFGLYYAIRPIRLLAKYARNPAS